MSVAAMLIYKQYALPPDPRLWAELSAPEPDDVLHNPDPRRDQAYDRGGTIFSSRGCANLGCLALLALGIMALLCVTSLFPNAGNTEIVGHSAGYPITSYVLKKTGVTLDSSNQNSLNLAGTNMQGQKPTIPKNRGLIDPDTPEEVRRPSLLVCLLFSHSRKAKTRTSFTPKKSTEFQLVFSDEFNTEGRSFYEGDDPVRLANRLLKLGCS